MTKSDIIRQIVAENGLLTNKQIRDEALNRFKMIVFDQLIVQVVGNYADRMSAFGGFSPQSIKRAKEFLTFCGGDYRHAKRLLEMACVGVKP